MYASFIAFPDRELLPTIQQLKRLDDGRLAFPLSADAILWGEVVDDKQLAPSICEADPCESVRHKNAEGPSDNELMSLETVGNQIAAKDDLVIDRDRFTVTYKGKPCFLGNTMAFQVIERLAKAAARRVFLSLGTLKQDFWAGRDISDEGVQRQISTLRSKLEADGVKGIEFESERKHYRLILR